MTLLLSTASVCVCLWQPYSTDFCSLRYLLARCRLEMLYAANIPVVPSSRFSRFAAGLRIAAEAGRRPHLLYGTKESVKLKMPMVLPPLLNSYLDEYNPAKGDLTVDGDREKIMELMEILKSYMKQSSYGYEGKCVLPFIAYS